MSQPSLLKSSSLKIVVSNFMTMIIWFIVIGIVLGFAVHKEFNKYLNETVLNTKSLLEESYEIGGQEALLDLLARYAKIASPETQIFFVANASNEQMLGNVKTNYRKMGWHNILPSTLGIDEEFPYHVYGYKVEGLYILIGNSRELTDELAEILLTVLGYGSLVILCIVFVDGYIIALRAQKRIKRIGLALDNIAEGNLDDRITLEGSDDDIDQLSFKINTTLNQLGSLFNGIQQVSSDIAHDLKTPINRLNMHIHSAAEELYSGKDPSRFLEKAKFETKAINETFEALLRISQIEAGLRKSRFVRLDLKSALEPIIDAYQPVFEDQGYIFQIDGIENTADYYVLADRELLMQMFANIIENAMRHCPKGTLISVRCQRRKKEAIITFCDTGTGIPEAETEKVFQRLYRLEKSRTTSGSGLGLSLVKAVADLHNIAFSLEDNGPGLCIVFRFKLV